MKVYSGKPKVKWRLSFSRIGKTLIINKIKK
jgi:hypothetical protein